MLWHQLLERRIGRCLAWSPVPVFQQPRAQIERLIVCGQLVGGATLPPIRRLATDLGIARGTVNKVYEALARDGLVRTAGRHGTVVQLVARRVPLDHSDLADAADALTLVVRQLGLDDDAAHRVLDSALRRW